MFPRVRAIFLGMLAVFQSIRSALPGDNRKDPKIPATKFRRGLQGESHQIQSSEKMFKEVAGLDSQKYQEKISGKEVEDFFFLVHRRSGLSARKLGGAVSTTRNKSRLPRRESEFIRRRKPPNRSGSVYGNCLLQQTEPEPTRIEVGELFCSK